MSIHIRNLQVFIQEQKQNGPFSMVWSNTTWALEATPTIKIKSGGSVSFRTESAKDAQAFDQPFADFARAVMSLFDRTHVRRPTITPYDQLLAALRALYEVAGGEGFDATAIDGETLSLAHRTYSKTHVAATSNRIGAKLEWLADLTNKLGITNIDSWSYTRRKEKKAPAEDDLLDATQLKAVAMVSNADLSPHERLLQCVTEFMLISGFRLGEAITLPRDTWVEEPQVDEFGEPLLDDLGHQVVFYGLRYWAEKSGSGVAMIKPLPSDLAGRARKLVDEALRLTHEAWVVAHHQAIQGRTTLGPRWDILADDALLSDEDVVDALGLALYPMGRVRAGKVWLAAHGVRSEKSAHVVGGKRVVRWSAKKGDVYSALLDASFRDNCRPDRRYAPVRLDELLFIKMGRGVRGVARMVTHHDIGSHLGCRGGTSVFDRLGIAEAGRRVRIRPKQFRSSMNVAAIRGGLNDAMVARLFARSVVAHNDSYDRRGRGERQDRLRDHLELGGAFNVVDLPMRPPVPRSAPLVRAGRAAHLTTMGVCYHHFAETPCEAHAAMVAADFADASLGSVTEDGWALLHSLEAQLAETLRGGDGYGRGVWKVVDEAAITSLRSKLLRADQGARS